MIAKSSLVAALLASTLISAPAAAQAISNEIVSAKGTLTADQRKAVAEDLDARAAKFADADPAEVVAMRNEMVALLREAQVFRPALRAAFVINRRVSTTVIGREARQALADQPLPALRAEVHQRIVFADSVAAGRLARETAPDSAAAREITALVDELLRWTP